MTYSFPFWWLLGALLLLWFLYKGIDVLVEEWREMTVPARVGNIGAVFLWACATVRVAYEFLHRL